MKDIGAGNEANVNLFRSSQVPTRYNILIDIGTEIQYVMFP